MTALSIIIDVVLILIALALIVAVLMQQGQKQGLGAIGGGAETFFGKNTSNSAEGKLKRITKILAVVFIVLASCLRSAPRPSARCCTSSSWSRPTRARC